MASDPVFSAAGSPPVFVPPPLMDTVSLDPAVAPSATKTPPPVTLPSTAVNYSAPMPVSDPLPSTEIPIAEAEAEKALPVESSTPPVVSEPIPPAMPEPAVTSVAVSAPAPTPQPPAAAPSPTPAIATSPSGLAPNQIFLALLLSGILSLSLGLYRLIFVGLQ